MKKFLSVLFLITTMVIATQTVKAQATVFITPVAGDTLVNVDTVTIALPTLTGNYAALSLTATVIATTSSVTGWVQVSFSDNGTDYDTLTRTFFYNATRPFKITAVTPTAHQYYRVKFYGTVPGQSGACRVWYKLGKSLTAMLMQPTSIRERVTIFALNERNWRVPGRDENRSTV